VGKARVLFKACLLEYEHFGNCKVFLIAKWQDDEFDVPVLKNTAHFADMCDIIKPNMLEKLQKLQPQGDAR